MSLLSKFISPQEDEENIDVVNDSSVVRESELDEMIYLEDG